MSDVLANLTRAMEHARAGNVEYQKAANILNGGPADYYFNKIEEYVTALFTNFAPFQEGDRVRLTAAPDCYGHWAGSKHFLIPGALGTVASMDYSHDQFWGSVMFDNESWIDARGVVHPRQNAHTYTISEKLLERVT
jgi:hypothetical protein